jgi:hypothetical protein
VPSAYGVFWFTHSHVLQALVTFFRGSPKNAAALRNEQQGRALQLLLNGDTRWNSTFDMLERVKKLLPAVRELERKAFRGIAEIGPGLDRLTLTRDEEHFLDLALDVRMSVCQVASLTPF